MPKRGKAQRKRGRTSRKAPTPAPAAAPATRPRGGVWPRVGRWLRGAGWWIGIAVTTIGFVATLLSFFPKFSVVPDAPLDPADPLSTPFVVAYDGLVPVRDVRFECVFDTVVFPYGYVFVGIPLAQDIEPHWMWPGDAATASCYNQSRWETVVGGIGPPLVARVAISIFYSPAWLPVTLQRNVIYRTIPQPDGTLRWIRLPP